MANSVAADRIARAILQRANPKMRFDVVDEDEARRALPFPGHMLQEAFQTRHNMLVMETVRVQAVIDHMYRVVGLAELELALVS